MLCPRGCEGHAMCAEGAEIHDLYAGLYAGGRGGWGLFAEAVEVPEVMRCALLCNAGGCRG